MSFIHNVPFELNQYGMGTWQLGGPTVWGGRQTGWGKVSTSEAVELLHYAFDKGINFLDTSDGYGKGQSETIIGKALGEAQKEQIAICTKFGAREDNKGKYFQDFSAEWLVEAVEGSLKRLNREILDVLLLHSPPKNFDWKNYDPTPFELLVKQGKIRTYGVSLNSTSCAKNVIKANFGHVIEGVYNMLDRRMDEDVFPLCLNHGYDFIARSVLAQGFLKNTPQIKFPEDDIRSSYPEAQNKWMIDCVTKLQEIPAFSAKIAESALRFSSTAKAVSIIIPGARKKRYVDSLMIAKAQGNLSKEQVEMVKQTIPAVYKGWR